MFHHPGDDFWWEERLEVSALEVEALRVERQPERPAERQRRRDRFEVDIAVRRGTVAVLFFGKRVWSGPELAECQRVVADRLAGEAVKVVSHPGGERFGLAGALRFEARADAEPVLRDFDGG